MSEIYTLFQPIKLQIICILTITVNNKQIFPVFLFNIRSYLPEVINYITDGEYFDIKQKRHGIFILLYATNTKQDMGS